MNILIYIIYWIKLFLCIPVVVNIYWLNNKYVFFFKSVSSQAMKTKAYGNTQIS